MEVQELLDIWKNEDNKLNDNIQFNNKLLRHSSFDKIQSLLAENKFENIFELVVNIVAIWILNPFLWNHIYEAKFAIPAAFLLVFMILGVVMNVYILSSIYQLNYKTPILEAQRKIERIKLVTKIDTQSLIVLIPLFSFAFLVVFLKGVLGLDIYQYDWIWSYTIGSFFIGIIIVYLLLKFPDKKMESALGFLKEIRDYEKE
ncbi:MAG: hypothetical protein ACI94Y_003374 [Maribacter sp.]|jgi:hypothetical protein